MASNNKSNPDDALGNPWDSIQIHHASKLFPDSVYEQASPEESSTLPTLDRDSIPQVSTVSGMFGINSRIRQVCSPSSTPVESSTPTLVQSNSPILVPSAYASQLRPSYPALGSPINFDESHQHQRFSDHRETDTSSTSFPNPFSKPPITNTPSYHEPQATQPSIGMFQRLYPNNPEFWPSQSNTEHNSCNGQAESPTSSYPIQRDFSRPPNPSSFFHERVPTPPSPPPSQINPWDCLDVLKIVAFQCSPSDEGNDKPIPHTNRLLHGTPRFCLNPLNFAKRREVGLQQILEFGVRIFAARRKVKDLFVDKKLRIPMEIEDFIQELGESAGKGRNDVPLREAVEDLEGFLRTVPATKRPLAYSCGQILVAVCQVFTRAMTDADRTYEDACLCRCGREEINHWYCLYTGYGEIVEFVESMRTKVMYMYSREDDGIFRVVDFEIVEGLLGEIDKATLLARRRRSRYPKLEKMREEDMGELIKRFKVLGKEVLRIFRERGVSKEEYSVEYYLDEWLSE